MNSPMPPALAAILGGGSPPLHRRGLPEAQVERLRELLELYGRSCPYTRGDLVAGRPGLMPNTDTPCIVLEVLPGPTTPAFGSGACCADERFDMRVAMVGHDGSFVVGWAASFRYRPWAEAAPAGAAA